MNEISQLLQNRFGMSEEQAHQAAQAVLELIKSKVPEQFQGILNTVLGSEQSGDGEQAGATSELGSLLGAATGLFGGHNS
jgi:hypothetical protein